MSTELHRKSIKELKTSLNKKELSHLELSQYFLERSQELNPKFNALLEISDQVLNQAQDLDDTKTSTKNGGEGKQLQGIPVCIKDNILVQGMKATAGSLMLQNFQSVYDASVVKNLKGHGALMLSKSNCDEFAMGSSNENSAFGPVLNPWGEDRVPGGSSGGSACSVSAGLAPLALGSDTGGSVRQPAAFCGIVGLKPTYGRVSRFGVMSFASSLDQVGPMGRRVQDVAYGFEAIAGFDEKDSTSSKRTVEPCADKLHENDGSLKGKTIAYAPSFFPENMNAEVKENFFNSIKTLESLGANCIEVDLPHALYGVACYYIIAPAEASANLARYDGIRYTRRSEAEVKDISELIAQSRGEGFGPEVKKRILFGTFVLSSGYYDAYYRRAQKIRSKIRDDFGAVFKKADFFVAPSAPRPAFKLGKQSEVALKTYLNDVFTVPVSVAGLPAISVPSGFSCQGLPIGLQIVGNYFEEKQLLECAQIFEQETKFYERPCP